MLSHPRQHRHAMSCTQGASTQGVVLRLVSSLLCCYVYICYAEALRTACHAAVAHAAKYLREALGRGKLLDRVGEVGVGALVLRYGGTYAWQQTVGILRVYPSYEAVAWHRELQNDKLASRLQRAVYLAEAPLDILEVTHTEGYRGDIYRAVGNHVEVLGIALLQRYALREPQALHLAACYAKHLLREVYAEDVCLVYFFCHGYGEVARAGGYIHDGVSPRATHDAHYAAAP